MSKNADHSIAALRKAVLNDPRNGELRYLLGAEMAQLRDYDGAVLELSAAIALSPALHIARFQLGLLHLTLGQVEHAVSVLAPLASLGEDDALKHFKEGIEALIRDDFSKCALHLKRGIELNVRNPPLNQNMLKIIHRVESVLSAQSQVQAPASDAQSVRTDFSLYGLSKH